MANGKNLRDFNPKGKVATLRRSDGGVLTENVAILLEIAGVATSALVEWLSFVSTEIHKQILWAHFDPDVPQAMKTHVAEHLLPKILEHPAAVLSKSAFLLGSEPTVADAYLFWTLLLLPQLGQALDSHPSLLLFRDRMRSRPAVRAVLAKEQEGAAMVTQFSENV